MDISLSPALEERELLLAVICFLIVWGGEVVGFSFFLFVCLFGVILLFFFFIRPTYGLS